MTANQLKQWLTPAGVSMTDAELQEFVGAVGPFSLAQRDAIAFAIAVLRDLFANDDDVRRWLASRHPGLGGSALDLLRLGNVAPIAAAAVAAWNAPWRQPVSRRRLAFVSSLPMS